MTQKMFQNKKTVKILISAAVFFIIILNTLFTVDQREQALVLEFGKTKRVIKTAGLKYKIPFLQDVVYFDKRILDLGIKEQEVIASDQKRLIINAFVKYKITDPLKFYQSVRSQYGLEGKLSATLDSSMRQVIGEVTLNELLTANRINIMEKIKAAVSKESAIFGVEIIDVRIMRGDLPKENSEAIFARMQTEREKEAREIRANGAEQAQKIKAEADKQKTIIIADAKKKSDILKGNGDAEANKIYANSYGKDPEFADFYRSMIAYKEAIQPDKTRIVISPDNEFFRYFNKLGSTPQ